MKIQSVKIQNHAMKKSALKYPPNFADTLATMETVERVKSVPINIDRMRDGSSFMSSLLYYCSNMRNI